MQPAPTAAVKTRAEDVLAITGLVKRYGERTVVDQVSFRIQAGETYGLLGPTGAGKTTIISMVAGLIPADAGLLAVVGEAMVPAFARPKGHIGLVAKELAIYPDLYARGKPAVLRTPPGRESFVIETISLAPHPAVL